MTKQEFASCLARLSLSEAEAALLLSVDARTVRRWRENPAEISGPAEQALRAWLRLESLGLAWRPDSKAIGEDSEAIAKQIVAYRNHAIELDALIDKVKKRGGPAAPWEVDLAKRRATLGALQISFYATQNGGFSPQSYTRRDIAPDMIRDRSLIEDGYAAVAREIRLAGPQWADRAAPAKNGKTKSGRKHKT